jgi:hypothetical protein
VKGEIKQTGFILSNFQIRPRIDDNEKDGPMVAKKMIVESERKMNVFEHGLDGRFAWN